MRVLAVVVRYKTAIADSETLQGFCRALADHPDLAEGYSLLIWDNSPEPLANPQLSIPFTYRHSGQNPGVSGAYNHAMQFALEHGHTWMLLLDQDSEITAGFLRTMLEHARALADKPEIAAVTPTVRVGTALASPRQQLFNKNRAYPAGESGIAEGEAIAINSGCLMRASALSDIGGFDLDFWLDYSDLYVFHQFYLAGKKVWRAADAELEHEMSIADMDRLMSPWRYRNFSFAESAFYDLYRSPLENLSLTVRLLARWVRQRRKYKNPEFARMSGEQFRNRVLLGRGERLERWRAQGEARRATNNARALTPTGN